MLVHSTVISFRMSLNVVLLSATLFVFFFFCRSGDHRDLHSFPTRRSSDLSSARVTRDLPPEREPRTEHGSRLARLSPDEPIRDRKSTRLNSSHVEISYAVFCLKKKKINF